MKNKKGFTLIELLAVIVILGLLMAIAIPSVTKYITQSRKKTVTTTIGNYIGALTNQVNDMEYIFTASNTVYAVPIECIALERGGTDPFGKWYQANDAYWAYVLVQYNDATSSYTYGFTFKDSAGYGLYPTTSEKLKESGSQILTDLSLTRPTNGKITNITIKDNWTGFNVTNDTNLVVLVASSEGGVGNGTTTCTLCQKGDNYTQVEEDKSNNVLSGDAYAIYTDEDKTLRFIRSETAPVVGDTYDDVIISNVYSDIENLNVEYLTQPWKSVKLGVEKVIFVDYIKPISTSYWFSEFFKCSYFDVSKLDTSNVTNMKNMFYKTGISISSSTPYSIVGMDGWDTSNVTNMESMFYEAGNGPKVWSIGDLSNWDVSKVTNMQGMFASAGRFAKVFSIGNLGEWDVSKVTNMRNMFNFTGCCAEMFTPGDLSKWDVSKVTDMYCMFYSSGRDADGWFIGDISEWDTSNAVIMASMFNSAGQYATYTIKLDLSGWNVSNVTSYNAFNNYVTDKITSPMFG